MPITASISVRDLNLDLSNYRTVPQPDETREIQAMISIGPDKFWGLMKSIIEDGYLPTESIIVQDDPSNPRPRVVKEGNRRIGALKLLLGILPLKDFNVPADVTAEISQLTTEWKTQNEKVPCTIFSNAEAATVDRIVARTHGKGENAGRDRWTAVARARHKRDATGVSDPALDLLEKYVTYGRNLTAQQKERWAGDYPLTVLDDAIRGVSKRCGMKSASELAQQYPAIAHRDAVEDILLKMGLGEIGFPEIRDKGKDFAAASGLPPISSPGQSGGNNPTTGTPGGAQGNAPGYTGTNPGNSVAGSPQNTPGTQAGAAPGTNSASSGQTGGTTPPKGRQPKTVAINDPRLVKRLLKQLEPTGTKRAKVVTLREEARNLNLDHNPMAFCFLLRSMFELSAKIYCDEIGLPVTKQNGREKALAELLQDVTDHLTNGMQDQAMKKILYGATTELTKSNGVLSVASLNQLVHNPAYSITTNDVCVLFGNVFPLLNAMNK